MTERSVPTTTKLTIHGQQNLVANPIIEGVGGTYKMPRNTFHRLRNILGTKSVQPEMAVRALMATVFSECCNGCNEKLRDEEFLQAFERMVDELLHVEKLSRVA